MARKNHQFKTARPAAQVAAMNLQSVMNHISSVRLPPRLKKPAPPRRRIAIVMVGASPETVKIRHVFQNLGSPLTEIRPTQSPRP